MKLDKRGFPTKPVPPSEWADWVRTKIAAEDLSDFFASQSRLHRRKARRHYALAVVFALIALVSALSLITDLIGGAA